jgi:hypothetical protein
VYLADDLPPGTYRLEVGLFHPFSRTGLSPHTETGWLSVLDLTVRAPAVPAPAPQHRLRAIAPGQWQIVGVDLPSEAQPGERVAVRLYWQAMASLPDLEVGARMLPNPDTHSISPTTSDWDWSIPGQGEYPTSSWAPGKPVITTHSVTMPDSGEEATVEVAVRERASRGSRLAFVPHWLGQQTTALELPTIQLAGLPAGAINYGDRIVLLDSDLEAHSRGELPPGAPVELAVVWRAAQEMEEDYTLFVQLLGPDGMPKGQIDVWPKNGTHPTSQWRQGEAVEDHYRVYLDPDAPPGQYQVAVGWYLLRTMERLPVLDTDGRAVDDKLLLPGPTVVRPPQ